MRIRALDLMACPACSGRLRLSSGEVGPDGHVETGELSCTGCSRDFAVTRGIPRLVFGSHSASTKTAARFAEQWHIFRQIEDHHRQQFIDWIAPVPPETMRGKTVLEAGCGKGRHTFLLAEWGVRDVVAIDLGDAVEIAFEATREKPNVHVVQTDLLQPGVGRHFDMAISVGVLHHLVDPEEGFRRLVASVRPGGRVITWTYGRENNGWIVHLVDPIRRNITSRLPSWLLLKISTLPSIFIWLTARALRRLPQRAAALFPYHTYIRYIGGFPYHEIKSIVYDQLTPQLAFYLPRSAIHGWYERAGLQDLQLNWHNRNSWRATALVPEGVGGSSHDGGRTADAAPRQAEQKR